MGCEGQGQQQRSECKYPLWIIDTVSFPALPGLRTGDGSPNLALQGTAIMAASRSTPIFACASREVCTAPTNCPFAVAAAQWGCSCHCLPPAGTVGHSVPLLGSGCEGFCVQAAIRERVPERVSRQRCSVMGLTLPHQADELPGVRAGRAVTGSNCSPCSQPELPPRSPAQQCPLLTLLTTHYKPRVASVRA